jgi:hypothetical protein
VVKEKVLAKPEVPEVTEDETPREVKKTPSARVRVIRVE